MNFKPEMARAADRIFQQLRVELLSCTTFEQAYRTTRNVLLKAWEQGDITADSEADLLEQLPIIMVLVEVFGGRR